MHVRIEINIERCLMGGETRPSSRDKEAALKKNTRCVMYLTSARTPEPVRNIVRLLLSLY